MSLWTYVKVGVVLFDHWSIKNRLSVEVVTHTSFSVWGWAGYFEGRNSSQHETVLRFTAWGPPPGRGGEQGNLGGEGWLGGADESR